MLEISGNWLHLYFKVHKTWEGAKLDLFLHYWSIRLNDHENMLDCTHNIQEHKSRNIPHKPYL